MMGIEVIVAGIFGIIVGAVFAWVALRSSTRSEVAVLAERTSSKDEQLRASWADLESIKTEFTKLQNIARNEQGLRIAAEQNNQRLPVLEKQLAAKDQQCSQFVSENGALRAQLAE